MKISSASKSEIVPSNVAFWQLSFLNLTYNLKVLGIYNFLLIYMLTSNFQTVGAHVCVLVHRNKNIWYCLINRQEIDPKVTGIQESELVNDSWSIFLIN